MDWEVLETLEKPVLDEDAFQQLLAAAYVIQEQLDALRASQPSTSSPSETEPRPEDALSIIAECQERLRSRTWDIHLAANLVIESLQRLVEAEGIAIGVDRGGMLEYVSACGSAASLTGVRFAMPEDLSLPISGIGSGHESSLPNLHESANSQNDIALPLVHEGKAAGIVEIRFANGRVIQETDLRCCQLMAGLMTEAIARAADTEWKQAVAAERATMLEELERIMPHLGGPLPPRIEEAPLPPFPRPTPNAALEQTETPAEPMKPELPLERTGTHTKRRRPERRHGHASARPVSTHAAEDQDAVAVPVEPQSPALPEVLSELASIATGERAEANHAPGLPAASSPEKGLWEPWISSATVKRWLEALQANGAARLWIAAHRADLYLATSVLMLAISLAWLAYTPHSAMAQSRNTQSLSLFERMLVALDLAEPPVAPTNPGNPNTMVWVDLHTALYYCPGTELYGKTEGGKFTTQRDAQIDQFQPAERKTCN